ncbi:hypothetical protein SJ_203 [Proteus phage SJ_PmiM]|nr:hypothetical protein SJ_203 [Proteus phage SJ_PmiM]
MIIKDDELFNLITEIGDFEEGGRIKHDMVECYISLELTPHIIKTYSQDLEPILKKHFPDVENPLEELKDLSFTVCGYTTYNDGFESHDDEIQVSKKCDNDILAYFKAMVKKYNLLNEDILLAVNKEDLAIDTEYFLSMLKTLPMSYKSL